MSRANTARELLAGFAPIKLTRRGTHTLTHNPRRNQLRHVQAYMYSLHWLGHALPSVSLGIPSSPVDLVNNMDRVNWCSWNTMQITKKHPSPALSTGTLNNKFDEKVLSVSNWTQTRRGPREKNPTHTHWDSLN